jgi:hypothetical protein
VKNNYLSNLSTKVTVLTLALSLNTPKTYALVPGDIQPCWQGATLFFFNGVETSKAKAKKSLEYIESTQGNHLGDGTPLSYELMYNQDNFLMGDFLEVFEQRLNEYLKGKFSSLFEWFWDAIKHDGPAKDAALALFPESDLLFNDLIEDFKVLNIQATEKLIDLFTLKPSAQVDYAEHRAILDKYALESDRMLFVAHSQGNLFMNQAFDYAKKIMPIESVSAVHVAPASIKLNGQHILANLDLVINGLRIDLPLMVPSITHYMPAYAARPAGINGQKDLLGHGFAEIYLNQGLQVGTATLNAIADGLNTVKPRPPLAKSGFFTISATWDGPGNVDLHVKEPNGTHVWPGQPIGQSGEIDISNSMGYGPERYYASCSPNILQPGRYLIDITNNSGAQGRKVTVTAHDTARGYLDAFTFTMKGATGTVPPSDYNMAMDVTLKPSTQRSNLAPSIKDYDVTFTDRP